MEYRRLGRTDMTVSAISFGAWAIGGSWGQVDDEESMRALHAAVDAGTNSSHRGRGRRLAQRAIVAGCGCRAGPARSIWVATKAGAGGRAQKGGIPREISPHGRSAPAQL